MILLMLTWPATAQPVDEQIQAILHQAQTDLDFHAGAQRADALFDQVIAYADDHEPGAFTNAAGVRRLMHQLDRAKPAHPHALLTTLIDHPKLMHALVFLVQPDHDDLPGVYALLDRLSQHRPEQLDTYANLAAALCVVHDQPLTRHVNENTVQAPDPLALFDYYVAHEKKMLFGLRNVPGELLVYIVDATTSLQEMQWALKHYAGDAKVGQRFFDIQYDYDHFRTGAPKKVTRAGFNLPNIRKFGGVCADQAYFAVSVGKAIGVPTTYTRGRGGDVSHAWVGFFQSQKNTGTWNFDIGRYKVYQGVQGIIEDPQTRQVIADGYVGLLAELIDADTSTRHNTIARTDAAMGLAQLRQSNTNLATLTPLNAQVPSPRRTSSVPAQLDLLQSALEDCPGNARAWLVVADLAQNGQLTLAQKRKWSDVLLKLCGNQYPDFTLMMVEPMVASIDDITQRDRLWKTVFNMFTDRHDLAAHVRMVQGKMWEEAGNPQRAGRCYESILTRYANAGPFVIEALIQTEKMLTASGRGSKVLPLYASTWKATKKPQAMAGPFMVQSNWYKVGRLYANRLDQAGQTRQAHTVTSKIQSAIGQ